MRSEVEEMSSKLNLRLSAAIKKMQEELSTSKTEIEAVSAAKLLFCFFAIYLFVLSQLLPKQRRTDVLFK